MIIIETSRSYRNRRERRRRFFNSAIIVICATLALLGRAEKATGEETIGVYFELGGSSGNKSFDERVMQHIENNLNDKTHLPYIEALKIDKNVYKHAYKVHSLRELACKMKAYAVEIKLINAKDNKVIVQFELYDGNNPEVNKPWSSIPIDTTFSGKDGAEISDILTRVIDNIRGQPYKILFTYCFEYVGDAIQLKFLNKTLPERLTFQLNEILRSKKLDKSFQAQALPCEDSPEIQKSIHSYDKYDYTVEGYIAPNGSDSVIVTLAVRNRGKLNNNVKDPGEAFPLKNIQDGTFVRSLASCIAEQWPIITGGNK